MLSASATVELKAVLQQLIIAKSQVEVRVAAVMAGEVADESLPVQAIPGAVQARLMGALPLSFSS